MDKHQIYHSDLEIMGGTPVFTGTRVPVDSLIIHLKAGDSLEQFLDGFPSVSREQAEAFLELALAEALERHSPRASTLTLLIKWSNGVWTYPRSGAFFMDYRLPLVLTSQPEGGYTVTSPLFPELITEGDSIDEALENVSDAFTAVIELYDDLGRSLPIGNVS